MISVLMSVYNEKLSEIRESIDSVLAQTYEDFELIVVLDNPTNSQAYSLLNEYSQKDSRIKVLVNNKNIGLAMSMNTAAEAASGEYFLRMDADDVCEPERFRLQYDVIKDGKYDLVCSNYEFIDEEGNCLNRKTGIYTDKQLDKLLPYRNIIHHPTIIMTAECFSKVGGYRNYPCAQDYDLWLRMKCAKIKMHMMPQMLLKYRVRPESTTIKKRYMQSCTLDYIRMIYKKSRMKGYSYEDYNSYLKKRGVDKEGANEDFLHYSQMYIDAKKNFSDKKFLKGMKKLLKIWFCSKYYRPRVLSSLKMVVIMKFAAK